MDRAAAAWKIAIFLSRSDGGPSSWFSLSLTHTTVLFYISNFGCCEEKYCIPFVSFINLQMNEGFAVCSSKVEFYIAFNLKCGWLFYEYLFIFYMILSPFDQIENIHALQGFDKRGDHPDNPFITECLKLTANGCSSGSK